MITSQQIAKEIDLKRFLSIVEDLPKIKKRTAYSFDLTLTAEHCRRSEKVSEYFRIMTEFKNTKPTS